MKVAYYHAGWARRIESPAQGRHAPRRRSRARCMPSAIGDGVIVTARARRSRSTGSRSRSARPGRPTLYAGYTNGLIGYLPTANEYEHQRLRGGLRLQVRRTAVAVRPQRRADPGRDGCPAGRAALPGGGAVLRARAWRRAAMFPRLPPRLRIRRTRLDGRRRTTGSDRATCGCIGLTNIVIRAGDREESGS